MGAGVTESYAAAAPARPRAGWWAVLTRHIAAGAFLAASLFTVMAVTGIGTGAGPLGPHLGHGSSITRDVGAEVTVGNVTLVNEGLFPLEIEGIRPLPEDGADAGVTVTAVEVAPLPLVGTRGYIGIADGRGYEEVPASQRRTPQGAVLPRRTDAQDRAGLLQVLVRYRLVREGTWVYRGYEVTYRSGLVRHRAVLDVTMAACAPTSQFPDGCPVHD